MEKNNILEISHLNKFYHDKSGEIEALKDITFSVKDKDFVSIIGPSGCGKSTILSILSSLDKASGGSIKYNKDNCVIGYMLQKDFLFPWRTILENCLIGLEINNNLNEENKAYVINLLKTYGLYEFRNKYPDSLSGGMRQRVALIRTLAIKPDILLLDEPLSALDYQSRVAIRDDIYNIIKKEGKTAIMVTHDIEEALIVSNQIIVLSKRPAVVKNIYNLNSSKDSSIHNRTTEDFANYYDKIWRDLDVHI